MFSFDTFEFIKIVEVFIIFGWLGPSLENYSSMRYWPKGQFFEKRAPKISPTPIQSFL